MIDLHDLSVELAEQRRLAEIRVVAILFARPALASGLDLTVIDSDDLAVIARAAAEAGDGQEAFAAVRAALAAAGWWDDELPASAAWPCMWSTRRLAALADSEPPHAAGLRQRLAELERVAQQARRAAELLTMAGRVLRGEPRFPAPTGKATR